MTSTVVPEDITTAISVSFATTAAGLRFVDPTLEECFKAFHFPALRLVTAMAIGLTALVTTVLLTLVTLYRHYPSPASTVAITGTAVTSVMQAVNLVVLRRWPARRPACLVAHEAILAIGTMLFTACYVVWWTMIDKARCRAGAAGAGEKCIYISVDILNFYIIIFAIVLRPRFATMLPTVVAIIVGAAVYFTAIDLFFGDPLVAVPHMILLAAIAAVVVAAARSLERGARQHFQHVVELHRANVVVTRKAEAVRDILMTVVPPKLVVSATRSIIYSQAEATVGIAEVFAFNEWSVGLMVYDVLRVLHRLLTVYDSHLDAAGVSKGMTFGDSYAVSCGLLEPRPDHAAVVLAFAGWQATQAAIMTGITDVPFSVRASVCTGELHGGLVGDDKALRFVLAGPAFEHARACIAQCVGGGVIAAALVAPQSPAALDALAGETPEEERERRLREDDAQGSRNAAFLAEATMAPVLSEEEAAAMRFSNATLGFAHAHVRASMALFVAAEEAEDATATTVVPFVAMAALLAAVASTIRAAPTVATYSALALLLLSCGVLGARMALALRQAAVPMPLAYGLTTFALACGSASFFVAPNAAVGLSADLTLALALPPLFPRLAWYAHGLLQIVATVVPGAVWRVMYRYDRASSLGYLEAVVVVLVVLTRYVTARGQCVRFVARRAAETARAAVQERAKVQDALLDGLLPLHVGPSVSFDVGYGEEGPVAEPGAVQKWMRLTALRVDLHFPAGAGVPHMASAWHCVGQLLAEVAVGLLEMVQATGDAFLAAGPFSDSPDATRDGECHFAALQSVEIIQRLTAALDGRCHFTAVAATGSAYGSLVGAKLLTYRLVGPVVRECSAIIAAATRGGGSLALCTDGFRTQCHNYFVPSKVAEPDLSLSRALTTLKGSVRLAFDDDSVFFGSTVWRLRSVGAAVVHHISLAKPDPGAATVAHAHQPSADTAAMLGLPVPEPVAAALSHHRVKPSATMTSLQQGIVSHAVGNGVDGGAKKRDKFSSIRKLQPQRAPRAGGGDPAEGHPSA
jgi:hypothetical protein